MAYKIMSTTESLIFSQTGYLDEPVRDGQGDFIFGYGFKNITEEEARLIMTLRVEHIREMLRYIVRCFNRLSSNRQDALIAMAYRFGADSITGKLLDALEFEQYERAAREMSAAMEKHGFPKSGELAKLMVVG